MILNKSQAEAVYSAMVALKKVEARGLQTTILTERKRIRIQGLNRISLTSTARNTYFNTPIKEEYEDQSEFAYAYGLN